MGFPSAQRPQNWPELATFLGAFTGRLVKTFSGSICNGEHSDTHLRVSVTQNNHPFPILTPLGVLLWRLETASIFARRTGSLSPSLETLHRTNYHPECKMSHSNMHLWVLVRQNNHPSSIVARHVALTSRRLPGTPSGPCSRGNRGRLEKHSTAPASTQNGRCSILPCT